MKCECGGKIIELFTSVGCEYNKEECQRWQKYSITVQIGEEVLAAKRKAAKLSPFFAYGMGPSRYLKTIEEAIRMDSRISQLDIVAMTHDEIIGEVELEEPLIVSQTEIEL